METLSNWSNLQGLIGNVPRGALDYSTNLYAAREQIERWCAAGLLKTLVADGAVLTVRADHNFLRIYHVARDLPSLSAALALLPAGRYVADLVGRGEGLDRLGEAYAAGGFAHYSFLQRMERRQAEASGPPPPSGNVVTAIIQNVDAVASFLEELLDPLSEQMPELDELRDAARDERLLVARQDAALAGMLMYERQGQLAHLRFWHVDPAARGAGIGRGLMGRFLLRCADVRRIVLWVIGDNDRSIAIYRHYGFETDGLLDRIMIADKES